MLNGDMLKRMATNLLSKVAESELNKIAVYTIEKFGINQARVYKNGLISCFQELTDRPVICAYAK